MNKEIIISIYYINVSLTDLARFLNEDDPRFPIQNWMRLRSTLEYFGSMEKNQ